MKKNCLKRRRLAAKSSQNLRRHRSSSNRKSSPASSLRSLPRIKNSDRYLLPPEDSEQVRNLKFSLKCNKERLRKMEIMQAYFEIGIEKVIDWFLVY